MSSASASVSPGISTLEVRWILRGPLQAATTEWFRRLPASTETREDTYLLSPWLDGLSVKIRADAELDVKSYGGSPGVLEVPGRARGRLDTWQKWSFPLGPKSEHTGDAGAWRRVRKVRTISWLAVPGDWLAKPAGLEDTARCAVELTTIVLGATTSWTLGFEASGPADRRRDALEAASEFVFAEPMPGAIQLRVEDSGPYAAWLRRTVTANPDGAPDRPGRG
jgi:hypothetical protein